MNGIKKYPIPGGIFLTVTERCELYDWRDACIAESVRRAIAEEREACAALAESTAAGRDAEVIAETIRMRSNAEITGAQPIGEASG